MFDVILARYPNWQIYIQALFGIASVCRVKNACTIASPYLHDFNYGLPVCLFVCLILQSGRFFYNYHSKQHVRPLSVAGERVLPDSSPEDSNLFFQRRGGNA